MENFNQKDDYTKATNSLDEKGVFENIRPADIPYKKYKALEIENEVLKDAIVKLTIKVISLEKALEIKDENR